MVGKIYDVDGNALSGATVTAYNSETHEWLPDNAKGTSEADGSYAIDLSNFPTDVETGNKIQIMAQSSDAEHSGDALHTAVAGRSGTQDLYLLETEAIVGDCRLYGFVASNDDDSTSYYFDLYDRYHHVRKMRIMVSPEEGTVSFSSKRGIPFNHGIAIIQEDATAKVLHVSLDIGRADY